MIKPLDKLTLEDIKQFVSKFSELDINSKKEYYCESRLKQYDKWYESNKGKLNTLLSDTVENLEDYKYSSYNLIIWLCDDENSGIELFSGDNIGFYYGFQYKNYLRINTDLSTDGTKLFNYYFLLIGMRS